MPKQVVDQFDRVVANAGGRADQFIGVVQDTCNQAHLGFELQPDRRGRGDSNVVLRGPLRLGRGANMELEVFADPKGSALHVGYQVNEEVLGGVAQNFGLLRELHWLRNRGNNNADAMRALSGLVNAFQVSVFLPVLEQLIEAVAQSQGGANRNGFLGA